MTNKHTLRYRLLVAINTVIAVLLLTFLFIDYNWEITDRVAEKHLAMDEEAKTLLHAILRMRPQGTQAVQEYVDAVCGQMQESHSPGHHITVAIDGIIIQALAHHRASPEMLQSVQAGAESPRHQANLNGEILVAGSATQDGLTVYVSEYLTNVLYSVRKQVWFRLGQIVMLAVVVEIVVSLVLVRMVAKPLEKLLTTVDKIGKGQLGVQTGAFKSAEFASLATSINSMSTALADADRHRKQQMAKARRIQEHLLPRKVNVPGLDIAHLYQPATEIAGDYYDVVGLADGTWLICIADVTGHGVPAAMSAAMLKALLLHATEHQTELGAIFQFINQRFSEISLPEDFATMTLIRWNPEQAVLEYGSAGHETAWFLPNAGTLRELSSTGLPLAVQEDTTWETCEIRVEAGDRLLLVTDGITEAFSPQEELFGRHRLAELFSDKRALSLSAMVEEVEHDILVHCGGLGTCDDSTLVAIEFFPHKIATARVA